MPDLPSEPSLQQLRHQARDLQRAVRRGDQDALAEVAGRHPAGSPDGAAAAAFPLSAAQLVVARRYDFPSWVRLRRYVEVVERYSRFPERMTAGGPENPADEFLRLACLYLIEHGAPAPDLGPGSASWPPPWSQTGPRSTNCGPLSPGWPRTSAGTARR